MLHRLTHLAFDRASSQRSFDADGRLHVADAAITAARVDEYLGGEIPDFEALRLDPSRTYRLLRDPEELRKAVDTFNNVPLLSRHVPVSADDHQPDLVVGSTGTDAEFNDPYLTNSLVVWAKDAIDDIECGDKKDLSCGYRYTAVMQPGTFEGVRYDGRMTQICANHVALVSEGRVAGAVIGDACCVSTTFASRYPDAAKILVNPY
jgi:hypothetical protein